MKKFRIQINELNNGGKEYIPQVGIPKLNIGRFCYLGFDWYNILSDNIDNFQITYTAKYIYYNEEEALNIIEKYKRYLDYKKSKENKSTSYKEIL
jgi:hypothetical protein